MAYAFTRDNAIPFSLYWKQIHARLHIPANSVWLVVLIAFLLGLPLAIQDVAFQAITSVTVIGEAARTSPGDRRHVCLNACVGGGTRGGGGGTRGSVCSCVAVMSANWQCARWHVKQASVRQLGSVRPRSNEGTY